VRIPPDVLDELVAHAREDAPNECCGFLALDDGVAADLRRVENTAHSPLRFEMDPRGLFAAYAPIEEAGRGVAVYHSHTRSAPKPSQTDINFSRDWPGVLWVIVGLSGEEPEIRAWWIEDGQVREEPVEV
jgi:proteasome lid subunit RPN8/RPN11